MRRFTLRLVFIAVLLLPVAGLSQVTDKAEVSGRIFGSPDETIKTGIREVHYTPFLLESAEGKKALQLFRNLKEQGHFQEKISFLQNSPGDQRSFYVRNFEEGTEQDPVFDEIEFELARTGSNVEVWVEVEELDEDRISEDILDSIMDNLISETPPNSVDPDRGIVEIVRDLFGAQPNVDGTGMLKILIADIQDGWDPVSQPTFTAGFFDPVHLIPEEEYAFSNEADIIYINSMPGIYRENTGFISLRLNTIAHELQHLIHANYDNLSIFQNEGQSELAEILTGFNARAMNFINSPSELSGNLDDDEGWIYRFRRNEPDVVLYDYQRAQLLHSYLEERIGPEVAASLTRSESFNDQAYMEVLGNIELEQFFTDFYVSVYAHSRMDEQGIYSFSRPQFSNLQVANPGEIYNAERQPWVVSREDTLFYGGSLYTQWFGVEDLSLVIESSAGITQDILYRREGETQFTHIPGIGEGSIVLDEVGLYEEIVLVSTNVRPTDSASPADYRTFTYSGLWTTTDLASVPLVYHTDAASYYPLPEPDDNAFAFALRISPDFDSAVQTVRFNINAREDAVQGDGELALRLREALEENGSYFPGSVISSQPVATSDISAGQNFFNVSTTDWAVQDGEEYFVTIEVIEDYGGLYLEFLLDNGTMSETDPNYNPVRTFVGFQQNGELDGWGYFQSDNEGFFHNNILMAVNLVGFRDMGGTDHPEPPVSEDFELFHNYPNPFRDETTIRFNVPEPSFVEISVHDVLGRKVSDLFRGNVAGNLLGLPHSVDFQSGDLASGIYFFRMTAEGESGDRYNKSRQMTLIR